MRVKFHPRARDEVDAAQAWYEERSPLAAAGFLFELSRSIERVREAPHRYPIALHGARRVILERFPFAVYYRTADGSVTVVAVAHVRRRPGYWAGR